MRGFVAVTTPEGVPAWQAVIEAEEARILVSLANQLQVLLADAFGNDLDLDTAVRRLLPDAYANDPDLAGEWRQLSRRALVDRKVGFAQVIARDLAAVAESNNAQLLTLSSGDALDWVRGIGDVRLVIADRLGIVLDGDEGDNGEPGLRELYDWLAWVQDDLVRVLDAPDVQDRR